MASYTKKQLAKIPAGTFITLKWNDAADEVVLLLEKIDTKEKGDVSLCYATWNDGFGKFGVSRHAIHSQIIGVGGFVKFPESMRLVRRKIDGSINVSKTPIMATPAEKRQFNQLSTDNT